jgi:large subunit ribosomal protein L21e
MVKRIGTSRRKTRYKLKRKPADKGKISLSKYFQKFEVGENVGLKINSAVPKGQFFPRFHGRAGKVTGMKGKCYQIEIKDGNKQKTLFVHPIHLVKFKN